MGWRRIWLCLCYTYIRVAVCFWNMALTTHVPQSPDRLLPSYWEEPLYSPLSVCLCCSSMPPQGCWAPSRSRPFSLPCTCRVPWVQPWSYPAGSYERHSQSTYPIEFWIQIQVLFLAMTHNYHCRQGKEVYKTCILSRLWICWLDLHIAHSYPAVRPCVSNCQLLSEWTGNVAFLQCVAYLHPCPCCSEALWAGALSHIPLWRAALQPGWEAAPGSCLFCNTVLWLSLCPRWWLMGLCQQQQG